MERDELEAARAALATWFEAHRRDLPWRQTRDPYAIWVSEVMLQQTRVDTVIPYYERFLEQFPRPEELAQADPEAVRAAWSGLGYYRRAAQLQRAAQVVVERHDGQLPRDPSALAELPGFGPYTVGAVASFAFDQPVPALDGNVKRVLARLHGIEGDLERQPARRQLQAVAERWVAGPRPGRTNESLMELGATVCAPRRPACSRCPLHDGCRARAEGTTDRIPPPKRRPTPRIRALTAVCAWTADAVLMELRGPGVFEGLWCLPMVDGEDADGALARLDGRADLQNPPEELGTAEHVLTHQRLRVRLIGGPARARPSPSEDATWIRLEELSARGIPAFTMKLLRTGLPGPLRTRLRWRGRSRSLPLFEG